MSECAIVAIPEDYDMTWKVSSEKIPHMTLLYLGELGDDVDELQMAEFVQHVAATAGRSFDLSVDDRGTLGDQQADVLFFEKDRRSLEIPKKLRSFLLTDPQIRTAYDSVEQYPEWTPHLTLGYPDAPAKPTEEDDRNNSIRWVYFDRIAIWFGDFDGPEFKLESSRALSYEPDSMMMSDGHLSGFLKHFGVKGMKWGKRKGDSVPDGEVRVLPQRPNGKLKAQGGKAVPAHEDAVTALVARQKARASTTNALSDQELKALVNRMNLEQQYSDLASKADVRDNPGRAFINSMLGDLVKQNVKNNVNTQVKDFMESKTKDANPGPRREYDEQFDKARRAANKR